MDREIDGDVEMIGTKTIYSKYSVNNDNEPDNRECSSEASEKEENGSINNETLKVLLEENNFSSSIEWLQNYFNLSIHDNKLSPITKVWLCLARLDGGSGQLLCQAMRWGIDGIRAWLASYVIWSPSSGHDCFLPSNRVNFQRTISDLSCLIDQIHPIELKNDSMVLFIKKALMCIESRQTHYSHINALERIAMSNNDVKINDDGADSLSNNFRLCQNVCINESILSLKSLAIRDNSSINVKSKVGYLIPLHCGHNGWPSSNEINLLITFIKSNIKIIKK